MISKYHFGKYLEIKLLWVFIALFAIGIASTLYMMPIPNLVKILVFSTIGLFALLQVLIGHETFIMMRGEKK